MSFDQHTSLEAYFVEAGRRAHVVWRLDGTYGGLRDTSTDIVNPPGGGSEGIWIEPLRVAEGVEFAIASPVDPGVGLERHAATYRRHHAFSEINYRLPNLPGLRLTKRVWVPFDDGAVVVVLRLDNRSRESLDVVVQGRTRFRLSLGWPVGLDEQPSVYPGETPDLLLAINGLGAAALVATPAPAHWGLREQAGELASGATRECSWAQEVTVEGESSVQLDFVIAASVEGAAIAIQTARRVAAESDDLLRVRRRHFERCTAEAPHLSTSDPRLDAAFTLARPALEAFKHYDPALGLGYFAGFPAYNFYFAGDAFRIMYGGIPLGDWEDSREILRTIIRGQIQKDNGGQFAGELWHELSTTGHSISPNFVTLELPSMLLHYLRWTGDLDFIRESYPAAEQAGLWAERKDRMGVGLPWNGPEQTFADGVREDLNVEGVHLTPALWQLRAQRAMAELARAAGRPTEERVAWQQKARRTRALIEDLFWSREDRRLIETIRPDGTADTAPGFTPWIELDDDLDAQIREASLQADLTAERALEAGTEDERPAFAERRQAKAYYLVERGDRARRLFAGGLADQATQALLAVASVPLQWPQQGFFPEIATRRDDVADLRGCFHQGWSGSYGLAYPVIAGLWGIEPDAVRDELVVRPRPPSGWSEMALEGLRVGSSLLSVSWRSCETGQELACRNDGGPIRLRVRFALPPDGGPPDVHLNDVPPHEGAVRRGADPGGQWIEVSGEVDGTGETRFELGVERSPAAGSGAPLASPRHERPGGASQGDGSRRTAIAPPRPFDLTVPFLLYSGFLAPPFDPEGSLPVLHVPANYAVRYPSRLLEPLERCSALALTDQQDAVLGPELVDAIAAWVERGGRLLFFCYWSAAWGRGFRDTFCSVSRTKLPSLLPLQFLEGIASTRQLSLMGPGEALWSGLPWPRAPRFDYNRATLGADATCWARAEDGTPIAAGWEPGRGKVVAIGLDLFGFGHGTVVHWPGQRPLLCRALDWLIAPTAGSVITASRNPSP